MESNDQEVSSVTSVKSCFSQSCPSVTPAAGELDVKSYFGRIESRYCGVTSSLSHRKRHLSITGVLDSQITKVEEKVTIL